MLISRYFTVISITQEKEEEEIIEARNYAEQGWYQASFSR